MKPAGGVRRERRGGLRHSVVCMQRMDQMRGAERRLGYSPISGAVELAGWAAQR